MFKTTQKAKSITGLLGLGRKQVATAEYTQNFLENSDFHIEAF